MKLLPAIGLVLASTLLPAFRLHAQEIHAPQASISGNFYQRPESHHYVLALAPGEKVEMNFVSPYLWVNVVSGKKLSVSVNAECMETPALWMDKWFSNGVVHSWDLYEQARARGEAINSYFEAYNGSARKGCMDSSEATVTRMSLDKYFAAFDAQGVTLDIPSPFSGNPQVNKVVFENPCPVGITFGVTIYNDNSRAFSPGMPFQVNLTWIQP